MLGMIGRRLQITRCDVCFKHAGKVKRFSGCVTKSVSGGTHGSFFKRSLLLDTVVAKATQRQTTTLLSPSVKTNNLLRGKSSGLILHCRSYSTGILPGTRQLHAYRMALPIQPNAPT